MNHPMRFGVIATVCALTLLLGAIPAYSQDAAKLTKARELIEENDEMILMFAHPLAEITGCKYKGVKELKDGFTLSYRMEWEGLLGPEWTEFDFSFTKEGTLDFVKTGGRSNILPPFTAADVAIGLVKKVTQDEPALKDNRELMKLIEKADARGLLEKILQLKQAGVTFALPFAP